MRSGDFNRRVTIQAKITSDRSTEATAPVAEIAARLGAFEGAGWGDRADMGLPF